MGVRGGAEPRARKGAHTTKARLTGKRLQGPGGMYGGPRTAPEPQKEGTENDDDKEETTDAD